MFSKVMSALVSTTSLSILSLAIAAPARASANENTMTASPPAAVGLITVATASAVQAKAGEVAAAAPETGTDSAAVGDIVVTAQRRAERLQDVPLAITAITPESATQNGIRNMLDIKLATPGVDFTFAPGFASLYIRGIGTAFATPGLEAPVALYLDNMYVPRMGGLSSIMDLVDPGSIEIIRGPQGTLYGRNATGGVIRISSANATRRLEGRVMAEYGSYDHKQIDGMLNVPLTDTLSVRFAGRYRNENGYVTNFDGTTIPQINNYTARGRFRWTPLSSLEVVGGVEWQRSKAPNFNDQLGLGAPTCYVCLSTGHQPGGFYDAAVNVSEPFSTRAFRADLRGALTIKNFVITSTTTYFNNNALAISDNDFTPVPAFFFNVHGNGGKTFSQELQVAYDAGGPLSLIGAVSYLYDKAFIEISLDGAAYEFARAAIGAFPDNDYKVNTKSYTGLLEGVYRLNDRIKVTVGGRYTSDRREQFVTNNAGFQLFGAPASFSNSRTFKAFTPRFVLAWDNGPTNIFYSYTRGFKAGGFVSPSPFPGRPVEAEKVFNHELGVKHSAFGGKLNTSFSMFYYKNKGLQQQVIDASSGGNITENAGSARGYGAEFEANARPFRGATVGASIGYLDAKYSEYPGAAVVCFDPTGLSNPTFPGATLYPCRKDLRGTAVPHAPKWTLGLNASYKFAIGSWSANISGLAQYRSSFLYFPGAGGELRYDQEPGYTIANFSGYVSPPGDRLRLGAYVDNAFNTKYANIRTTSQPWGMSYEAARPVTYGARVEYKF